MPSAMEPKDENHAPHDWARPPQFKIGFLWNGQLSTAVFLR